MKPLVYHIGLTPPPSIKMDVFDIFHYPVLKVIFKHHHLPDDINEILKQKPVLLLISKNAVIGLSKWLFHHDLDIDYFKGHDFWTIGNRTQDCLMDVLEIESFHPSQMTGRGILNALIDNKKSKIILMSGNDPQEEFIEALNISGINFFHFPIYEIKINNDLQFSIEFKNSKSNYLVITSPKSIDGILENLAIKDLSSLKPQIISMGPTTSSAINKHKGHVFHESRKQNISALYDDLMRMIA